MSAFVDVTISGGILTVPAPVLTAATASSAQLITAAQANDNYAAVQPINIRVVSEGGAGAADTITSIAGLPDGREVLLSPRDDATDITISQVAGSIELFGSLTATMVSDRDVMLFIQKGSVTIEKSRNF